MNMYIQNVHLKSMHYRGLSAYRHGNRHWYADRESKYSKEPPMLVLPSSDNVFLIRKNRSGVKPLNTICGKQQDILIRLK